MTSALILGLEEDPVAVVNIVRNVVLVQQRIIEILRQQTSVVELDGGKHLILEARQLLVGEGIPYAEVVRGGAYDKVSLVGGVDEVVADILGLCVQRSIPRRNRGQEVVAEVNAGKHVAVGKIHVINGGAAQLVLGKVQRAEPYHVLDYARNTLHADTAEVQRGDLLEIAEGDEGVVPPAGRSLERLEELGVRFGLSHSIEER